VKPPAEARELVAAHLRELPNVALDAALELADQHGAGALVLAISDEFARRFARHRHAIHIDQS
jgi:hypothetical protein